VYLLEEAIKVLTGTYRMCDLNQDSKAAYALRPLGFVPGLNFGRDVLPSLLIDFQVGASQDTVGRSTTEVGGESS
jgi:hypothetical protein